MQYSRRDAFKMIGGGVLAGMFAGHAQAAPLRQSLSGLRDVKTGETFSHMDAGFTLAYFGTASPVIQGCSGDLGNMRTSARIANAQLAQPLRLLFIYPQPAPDDAQSLVKAYVTETDNQDFTGLSGEPRDVLLKALAYGAPYEIDRRTKNIVSHVQNSILIAPDGRKLQHFNNLDPFKNGEDIIDIIKGLDVDCKYRISCG